LAVSTRPVISVERLPSCEGSSANGCQKEKCPDRVSLSQHDWGTGKDHLVAEIDCLASRTGSATEVHPRCYLPSCSSRHEHQQVTILIKSGIGCLVVKLNSSLIPPAMIQRCPSICESSIT